MAGATKQQRDGWRYGMLRKLYDVTGGHQLMSVNLANVAEDVGVPEEEWLPAHQWLMGEGLIKDTGGNGRSLPVFITHAGVREVEASMDEPTKPTDHFSPAVIQQVTNNFSGPVGAVQTGSQNVAHVTQNVSTDVQVLLQQLRGQVDALPAEKREEAAEIVDELEEQAKAPSRSKVVMRSLLAGLKEIFIGAASGAGADVAAELGKKLLVPLAKNLAGDLRAM